MSHVLVKTSDGSREELIRDDLIEGENICPFHDDHDPSMTVYSGFTGFNCWVCGASGKIVTSTQNELFHSKQANYTNGEEPTALDESIVAWGHEELSIEDCLNATPKGDEELNDLLDNTPTPAPIKKQIDYNTIIREHIYKDVNGNDVKKVVYHPYLNADGKNPRPYRWEDGEWKIGLTYTNGGKVKKILYNLDLFGDDLTKPLFITEGEKDCDTIRVSSDGSQLATTLGSCISIISSIHKKYLINREEIIISGDRDEPGANFIYKTVRALIKIGYSLDKIKFANFENIDNIKGYDISDAITSGKEIEIVDITNEVVDTLLREYNISIGDVFIGDPSNDGCIEGTYLFEENGGYCKLNATGNAVKVTDFTIKLDCNILEQTDFGELWYHNIYFKTQLGDGYEKMFRTTPDSFDSVAKFKKLIGGNSWFNFSGTEKDLGELKTLIQVNSKDKYKLGFHNNGLALNKRSDTWTYIEDERVIDKDGDVDEICKVGGYTGETDIISNEDIAKDEIEQILEHLFNFNNKEVTVVIMGYLFLAFIKERFRSNKSISYNPVLFLDGPSNCGKSETIEALTSGLFSSSYDYLHCNGVTQFVLDKALSSTNIVPRFLDEYKFKTFQQAKKDIISSSINAIYNYKVAERGNKEQSINKYPLICPLIIAGETGTDETSHQHRMINIHLTPQGKMEGSESFFKLKKLPLSKLGYSFLKWSLEKDDDYFFGLLEFAKTITDEKIKDRSRINLLLCKTGLFAFCGFLQDMGIKKEVITDITKLHILIDRTLEESQQESEITLVDKMMVHMAGIINTHPTPITADNHYTIAEHDEKAIFAFTLTSVYTIMKQDSWKNKDLEFMALDTFRKQLKGSKYFVEMDDNRFKLNGKRQRCMVLNLEMLEEATDMTFSSKWGRYIKNNSKDKDCLIEEPVELEVELDDSDDFKMEV